MDGFMMFFMILLFIPPVGAVFVLWKRLRGGSSKYEDEARDRLFQSMCEELVKKKREEAALSKDEGISTDEKKISTHNDNKKPEIIRNAMPLNNQTETEKTPEEKSPDLTVNKPEKNENTDASIKKEEAINMVMNMMKSKENGKSSDSELQEMIALLKKGKGE